MGTGIPPSGSGRTERCRGRDPEIQCRGGEGGTNPNPNPPPSETTPSRLAQRAFSRCPRCSPPAPGPAGGALPAAARRCPPPPHKFSRCSFAFPFPSMPFGGVNPCRMAEPTPAAERGHFSPQALLPSPLRAAPLAAPPALRPPRPTAAFLLSKAAGDRSCLGAGAPVPRRCDGARPSITPAGAGPARCPLASPELVLAPHRRVPPGHRRAGLEGNVESELPAGPLLLTALRAARGLQFSIFREVTFEVGVILLFLFLCFIKKSKTVPMLGMGEWGKGQTQATQRPSRGKAPARGRLLPLEHLGCGSFHGCYRTPPFLVLYIPGSSLLQMKMEHPVASQETRRCGFTLAQEFFAQRSLYIQH